MTRHFFDYDGRRCANDNLGGAMNVITIVLVVVLVIMFVVNKAQKKPKS